MTFEKRAPRANPVFFGQEQAVATLSKAWFGGRSHHAWLLCGPQGVGKATLAFRFARFLLSNSPKQPDFALASAHPVYCQVAAGSHPDLLVIERLMDVKRGRQKSSVGVEQIRRVADFMHLTPAGGGWRVVIIDPVDDLNVNAANALLKILEEPPPRALLLLISHAPGSLLPTVRSRCRVLPVDPLPDHEVEAILLEQGADSKERDFASLIRLADGSVGRAFTLLEQGGVEFFRDILAILSQASADALLAQHQLAEKLSKNGAEAAFDTFFDLWDWWLQRIISRLARGTDAREIERQEVVAGEAEVIGRLSVTPGLAGLLDVWEKSRLDFVCADRLTLDKKQVILNAFSLACR